MTESRFCLVLMVLTALWNLSRGDSEVTCVFNCSCVLPCEFQFHPDPVIHWIYMKPENPHVHSYYSNKDQLGHQPQQYRNRTSLFQDQISRGNASLLLRGVKVQDQGRYKCYTGTIRVQKETFINMNIEAPVSEVHISQEGNWISCSSEGIYPEPGLTWSTIPPSNMELQNRTRVHQTEEQLYDISSSLMVSDRSSDLSYSCTVRTQRNQRTASFFKSTSVKGSESRTTISCNSSDVPVSNFIWRFNNQIIVTKTEGDASYSVSEEWREHLEEVSESGSLTLHMLSSTHEGLYTCEVRNNTETIITERTVQISEGSSLKVVLGSVSGGVLLIIIIGFIIFIIQKMKKKKKKKKKKKNPSQSAEPSSDPSALEPLTSGEPDVPNKNLNKTPVSENQGSDENTQLLNSSGPNQNHQKRNHSKNEWTTEGPVLHGDSENPEVQEDQEPNVTNESMTSNRTVPNHQNKGDLNIEKTPENPVLHADSKPHEVEDQRPVETNTSITSQT